MNWVEKKVSVIITCYNYGYYLASCIESVLSQTYPPDEIIVVNDGSTDHTDEVIEQFLPHEQLKYVKQANAGQASAKNAGIRHASGKLLAFLDADDQWDHRKLEKQVRLFEDPRVGVVYSRAKYIDETGDNLDFKLTGKYLIPRSGDVTRYLLFDNFVPFSSSVVRKTCIEHVGGFDESLEMGIDWDLWLRISIYYRFAFVQEPLLLYRIGHSGQMSKNLVKRLSCADHIFRRFVAKHRLEKSLIREALAHSHCSRGYYHNPSNLALSTRYYLRAVKECPWKRDPYLGLFRNLYHLLAG